MQSPGNIKTLFIAGFGPIVPDRAQSKALYGDAPCGQTVSRFLTPEGLLLGIAFTPFLRGKQP